MRRALTLAGAALACALASAGAAHGQDGKGEPFELVRSLQSLQDQVARGNTRAHAAQRELLGRIAEQFDALSPERWKDPRNVRAAVVFVLSGGSARVLQKLLGSAAGEGIDEKLIKGALAYGEGRRGRRCRAAERDRGSHPGTRHGRACGLRAGRAGGEEGRPPRPSHILTMHACFRPARSSRRPHSGAGSACWPQPATPIATRRWRHNICAVFPTRSTPAASGSSSPSR